MAPTLSPDLAEIRAAFRAGEAAARDPINRTAVRGGTAITTLQSPWLYHHCPVCAHTFRLDDPVFIDDQGSVRHHSAALPCSGQRFAHAAAPTEVTAFYRGLDRAWPPPPGIALHRLDSGHPLLGLADTKRHQCSFCGHTLRPHDQVVICPCSPKAPKCQVVLHRDPMHGLTCWDAWCPDDQPTHCLGFSRVL